MKIYLNKLFSCAACFLPLISLCSTLEYMTARHDISSCHYEWPLDINYSDKSLKDISKKKASLLSLSLGKYVCDDPSISEFAEWANVNRMYIIANATNDIHLIVENKQGVRYKAYNSDNGFMNARTLFFGQKNNGLCFYYQVVGDDMYTIFSPCRLQKKLHFKRVDINFTPSVYIEKKCNSKCVLGQSFTNIQYYVDMENSKSRKQQLRDVQLNKYKSIYGTYVCENKEMFNCDYWKGATKIFIVLNNRTDIYIIEEVAGELYLLSESSNGKMTDMFLEFGRSSPIKSLYKVDDNILSAVFTVWEKGYTKEHIERSHFLFLSESVFQKEVHFKKTEPISIDAFPDKARLPWWKENPHALDDWHSRRKAMNKKWGYHGLKR